MAEDLITRRLRDARSGPADERKALQALVADLSFDSPSSGAEMKVALDAGCSLFEFESGVVYLPSKTRDELVCVAHAGCPALTSCVTAPTFSFTGDSFVARVFSKGALGAGTFIKRYDPLDQDADAVLGIVAPAFGVPLIGGTGPSGVIVFWNLLYPRHSGPTLARLEAFGRLVARLVDLTAQQERHVAALRDLPAHVSQALQDVSQDAVLSSITKALLGYPFDRVQIFEYRDVESEQFVPIVSAGLDDPERFLKGRITVSGNHSANDTVTKFRANGANQKPILYDHPNAESDPDVAWIENVDSFGPRLVAPLSLGDQLLGQIVVDNPTSRRPLNEDGSIYLHAISALAAGAIANRRSIQYLGLNSLPVLYRCISPADSEASVIKKLLAYLTCGEALGFSRAVYFERKDKPQRLVYRASIGSVTEERFRRISRDIQGLSLQDILTNAPKAQDEEIDQQMSGFTISLGSAGESEIDKEVRQTRLEPASGTMQWHHSHSDKSADLKERMNSQEVFTVPVRAQQCLVGLFVVDRQWQPHQPRSDVDRMVLSTFAEVASQIIEQNRLQIQASRQEIDGQWEAIANFAAHECMRPTRDIENHLDAMLKRMETGRFEEARKDAAMIRPPLLELFRFIDDFLHLNPRINPQPVMLNELLDEALKSLENDLQTCEIDKPVVPAGLLIQGDRTRLITCLKEVLSNAVYWCTRSDSRTHRISIETSKPSGSRVPASLDRTIRYALLRVEDSGPGVPPEDVNDLFRLGYTRRANDGGHGVGLFMVKRILRAHGGDIYAEPGPSGKFFLFIPRSEDFVEPTSEEGHRWKE